MMLLGVLVLLGALAAAQPTIRVEPEVLVTGGFAQDDFWEPHLVALPADPLRLIAVAFRLKAPPGPGLRSECIAFVSTDGGDSWSRSPSGTFDESRICVDPWLAVDRKGAVFLAYLHSFEESESDFRLGVRVRRSLDGGLDWSDPVSLPLGAASGYDKPSIVADAEGAVYVHAAAGERLASGERVRWIAAARSTDRAASFSLARRINEGRLTLNSGNPALLPDGTLLIPFNEVGTGGASGLLRYPRIWVARSEDGGRTFSLPFLVTEQADAYPYTLAIDGSGSSFQNRAYLAFKGRREDSHIYVTSSSDGGRTWSEPIRANDNPDEGAFHLAPMMAVNLDGVVLVAWYDRRSDPLNLCTEIYASASVDGGASFLPNVLVSRERSCAPDDGRGVEMQKWRIGGEYAGIAASADGAFHLVWSDARSGRFQIRASRLTLSRQ